MHFTIVIPTRERAETLKYTLETCVAQNYDQLEILVSDNVSADETRNIVHSINDKRIRYISTGQRLSMAENFEFALSQVKPGFVITIGDDDGLPAGAISKACQIAKDARVKSITTERAQYDWPGMSPKRENQILFSTRDGCELRETKKYYPKVLNGWKSYYQIPLLYHCYFSTEILDLIKAKSARLFNSQQIDIYSSMLLGGLVNTYAHSFDPLVINGSSVKSNGAQHFGQVKDTTEVKKWQVENNIPLRAPFVFAKSIRYLILESYLQAQEVLPELSSYRFDLKGIFLNALAELELSSNLSDKDVVISVAKRMGVSISEHDIQIIIRALLQKLNRYANRALHLLDTVVIDCAEHGVTDINGASQLMDSFKTADDSKSCSLLQQIRLAMHRR